MILRTPKGYAFDPLVVRLGTDDVLYRVHSQRFRPVEFNPGVGQRSRFGFFDDDTGVTVPVLYAASSQEAAVCETILHDVPPEAGRLFPSAFQDRVMSRIRPAGTLRLASFTSEGLRRLGSKPSEVTNTFPAQYRDTAEWARVAHRAGLDGAVWVSDKHNESYAYVVFGDRAAGFEQDTSFARAFGVNPVDADWLVRFCEKLGVVVVS